MKKSFTPHEWNALFRQATSLISRYVLLFFCLLIVLPHFSFGQQFVKTYNSSLSCNGPAGNLMFGCITKSKKAGRYFIAGTQDTSIYVCEVDAMGTVLQEKLLDVKNATTVLRSMITDDDGNIVMVGTTYTGGYSTFLLKLSPAFSILIHRTYNLDATGKTSTYFTDVKDHKFSTTYYISGAILSGNTFDYTVGDAMLLQVDRNTGNIVNRITGNAGQVDSYDALVFHPNHLL